VIGRLQLTSMIDVIFLLLIFFMVTTTFSQPESRLSPGLREERTGAVSDLTPQIIDVSRENGRDAYRMGDRVYADRAALTEALRALPREPGVFVRAADSASVAAVAAALQAARDAGFDKVSYVPAE